MAFLVTVLLSLAVQEDVEALLRKLGSDRQEEREAASVELIRRGRPVRDALERMTRERDPEIAGRARQILTAIDFNLDLAVEVLGRTALEEKESHQRFLWRAQKWLEKASSARSWEEILASLERQKIDVTDVWERDSGVTHRFLALKEAAATPQGQKMDLYFEFVVKRVVVPGKRTQTTIESAAAGLLASVRLPLEAAAKTPRFPADSAIQKVLASSEMLASNPGCYEVDRIEMTYGPIRDRWRESVPSGFHLSIECADHLEGKVREYRRSFTVASGLDPERTHDGAELTPSHVPQDTLGAPRSWGSNSTGAMGHGLKRLDLPSTREPSFSMGHSKELVPQAWSLPDLAALPDTIRSLRIRGKFLADDDVKGFARFSRLEKLNLYETDLGDDAISSLAALPAVTTLCIRATKLTDRGFERLRDFPKLTHLEISRAELLTDEGLRHVGSLKSLTVLELRVCPKITDQGLRALSGLVELDDLYLWTSARITDEGLAALGKLPKLRAVQLGDLKEITPAGWAALAKGPALRELYFNYCSLDDDGMAELGRIKNLEFLASYQWRDTGKITDQGVLQLQGLTRLRRLNIFSKPVTEEGMKALQDQLVGRYVRY
jgi:hypothetical protein